MKNKIKKHLPFIIDIINFFLKIKYSFNQYFGLINAYFYDYKRYLKYSATKGFSTEKKQISFIIMEYHALEKGLTMPDIRYGFAQYRIGPMVKFCLNYSTRKMPAGITGSYPWHRKAAR